MELLSAPLSAWHNLSYDAYAEWVGARARVELLRAHAQVRRAAGLRAAPLPHATCKANTAYHGTATAGVLIYTRALCHLSCAS